MTIKITLHQDSPYIERKNPCLGLATNPLKNILGDLDEDMRLRKRTLNHVSFICYLSQVEPKKVEDALNDKSWINAMHEEFHKFTRNYIWDLVPRWEDNNIIRTKWIFKNKSDEHGVIIHNKARLVAQGYTQIEGIDFDETFVLVIHLEYVHISLAIACHLNIKPFQMDVKSTFFDHVYILKKALYKLKKAPRAQYESLTAYLVEHKFKRGKNDKTLFVRKIGKNALIAQICLDDIVFGSTLDSLSHEFACEIKSEFKMSMIG